MLQYDVIKLPPPLFDSCGNINSATCPDKGGNMSPEDVHEITETIPITNH